jgi:hypothetical protein
VVFNVFNNKNVGAIIIYVDKWYLPGHPIVKIESEFFGDYETI